MEIFNADCLEKMKDLIDDSIDLIFCDLPYGQTSCKWDCKIDLEQFWKQLMRIKKTNTPIFFTTTTKFGVELINSAPKKCPFRYDIVWLKSAPAGFLSAKKMPMRKHEMLYVFYEKLPFYDLSSHTHKFLKEVPNKRNGKDGVDNKGMIKNRSKTEIQNKYDPPLPVSVVKEDKIVPNEDYDKREKKTRNTIKKEENYGKGYLDKKVNFRKYDSTLGGKGAPSHLYEPPLPVSVVKEETDEEYIQPTTYGKNSRKNYNEGFAKEQGYNKNQVLYDPPLPTSALEIKSTRGKHSTEKPVALMEWILKYYSKEGDVVLDATMGSGSMGVACKNMKRAFIGIEKDEEIFKVAEDRLK